VGTLASELGNQIDKLSSRTRVYVDANVPAGVVLHMRNRLKWDVLAVIEDDSLRRASDLEHYRIARKLRRTLISLDGDFLDERRFPTIDSGGVVILSAPDERGLVRLVNRLQKAYFSRTARRRVRSLVPPLLGEKIRVHPDGL